MNVRTWILLAIVAVFSVPAFAQYQFREIVREDGTSEGASYDLGRYMDNPCTAVLDRVYVNYNVDLYQEYWETNDRFLFDESTMMGGTMYSAAGSTQSDVGYQAPFTLRKYHKVNTSDNFHVVTVINFYPATHSTSVTVETACGNGMPDSKE